MIAYRHILCPVDFSDASYAALQVASELAVRFSAKLTVVHVVFHIPPTYGIEGLQPELDIVAYEKILGTRAQERLEEEVPRHIAGGQSPRCIVRHGDAAQQIIAAAEKEGADLIVLATHGMTGWRHYVFGSVAQKVVQHTDRHVLFVPMRRPEGQTEAALSARNAVKEPVQEKELPCTQPA